MLDPKVTELADRMIEVQFEEQQKPLKREIQKLEDEFRLAGARRSPQLVLLVKELCNQEVVTRTLIVWQTLLKVLAAQSTVPAEGLGDALKQEVLRHREVIISGPSDCLRKTVNKIGPTTIFTDLTDGWEHARKKVLAEIDLSMLRFELRKEAKEGQVVFNLQGSQIGAIQTGPDATANIAQTLTPSDREALLRALDLVKQGLDKVERLPAYPKEEVADLADEAKTELSKAKPNGTRLSSILTTVATAIQTVGNLKPAYQAFKAALLPLGILLP